MSKLEDELRESREAFLEFAEKVEKWLEETDPERKEDHE